MQTYEGLAQTYGHTANYTSSSKQGQVTHVMMEDGLRITQEMMEKDFPCLPSYGRLPWTPSLAATYHSMICAHVERFLGPPTVVNSTLPNLSDTSIELINEYVGPPCPSKYVCCYVLL